ncbi:MAG: hypothetical protein WCO52_01845 [bacterium]
MDENLVSVDAIIAAAQAMSSIPDGEGMPLDRAAYAARAYQRESGLDELLEKVDGQLIEPDRGRALEAVAGAIPVSALLANSYWGIKPSYVTFFVGQLGEEEACLRLNEMWRAYSGDDLPLVLGKEEGGEHWGAYPEQYKEMYCEIYGFSL